MYKNTKYLQMYESKIGMGEEKRKRLRTEKSVEKCLFLSFTIEKDF
jgi:hypothetical protein